jgi:hypothetical protein
MMLQVLNGSAFSHVSLFSSPTLSQNAAFIAVTAAWCQTVQLIRAELFAVIPAMSDTIIL